MINYTGDIYGQKRRIVEFCHRFDLTEDDVIVLLGDVGANFYENEWDQRMKRAFARLKPTILCIHGNHEIRPANLPGYRTKEWNGGIVWYEEEYPNLLFAKDGEIFTIEGLTHLVIGGAYSVDKHLRLLMDYGWWSDEQPSDEIKAYVEQQILGRHIDVILSHTCPYKYEPVEAFLPMVDQSTVDASTEKWLDRIEETAEYDAWLCGHWHIDKRVDRLRFLYQDVISRKDLRSIPVIRKQCQLKKEEPRGTI